MSWRFPPVLHRTGGKDNEGCDTATCRATPLIHGEHTAMNCCRAHGIEVLTQMEGEFDVAAHGSSGKVHTVTKGLTFSAAALEEGKNELTLTSRDNPDASFGPYVVTLPTRVPPKRKTPKRETPKRNPRPTTVRGPRVLIHREPMLELEPEPEPELEPESESEPECPIGATEETLNYLLLNIDSSRINAIDHPRDIKSFTKIMTLSDEGGVWEKPSSWADPERELPFIQIAKRLLAERTLGIDGETELNVVDGELFSIESEKGITLKSLLDWRDPEARWTEEIVGRIVMVRVGDDSTGSSTGVIKIDGERVVLQGANDSSDTVTGNKCLAFIKAGDEEEFVFIPPPSTRTAVRVASVVL